MKIQLKNADATQTGLGGAFVLNRKYLIQRHIATNAGLLFGSQLVGQNITLEHADKPKDYDPNVSLDDNDRSPSGLIKCTISQFDTTDEAIDRAMKLSDYSTKILENNRKSRVQPAIPAARQPRTVTDPIVDDDKPAETSEKVKQDVPQMEA